MIHRFNWQLLSLVLVLILVACGSDVPTPEPTSAQTQEAGPTTTPTPSQSSDTPSSISEPTPELIASVNPTPTPVPATETGLALPNIADTVDEVRPAVVGIVAEFITRDFLGNLISSFSSGTGVIFAPEGLALTNSHVIRGASAVTVTLDDGTQLEAEIVGVDRLSDLGVLRLPEGTYPFLPIENGSETLRVGDWVIAIGNALALPGDLTVTVGVVSALRRTLDVSEDVTLYNLIQTDAVINPGNSGGPLLNLRGKLVGINTAVLRRSNAGGRTAIEGIGFAINTETATLVSDQLVDSRRVRWAWMGAFLGDLIPEVAAQAGIPIREGVVIRDVLTKGPADLASIQRGDIILSVEGNQVTTVRDLTRLLRQEFKVDQEIEVELFRDGATLTLPMVLGERPR
ncbi:MAG: trypsin-like peptidase domain-containing protein [Chloroflexi bacterium]|nr:trypsin-like peptidase domain-containing protein [Chloroflexota bacterium]